MTMTSKQYARTITVALASYQKGEDRLNDAVMLAIRHAAIYRAPDQLANVHAAMIANANTGLAKKFRQYVKEVSAWVWNDKASTFSLRKKIDENEADFYEAWNNRLSESWRVDADKVEGKKQTKPKTRTDGVKKAIKQETVHNSQDRQEALATVVADMTQDEIYQALVNASKIDGLLNYIADQQQQAA